MTTTAVRRGSQPVPTAHRRRRWPIWFALVLVLALAAGGVYVLFRTSVLGVTGIEVSAGSGAVSAEVADEVRAAADIPIGTPLVSVDLAAVQARVEQVLPVSKATVARHWPHSVKITVTTRVPAAVTSANGSIWLLDATGFPYLKVASRAAVPAGLITVELATPGAKDPSTVASLAVIAALRADFRPTVAAVTATSAYAISLALTDGRKVIWGSPDLSAKKMQILPAVLARPGRIFDVSDPDLVTVGP